MEALAKAKAENKLVFLDCYTSWCGPCKEMANVEFPKKAAGDYFNPRFISVKFDIEKGEGKEVAKRYHVSVVPTFLLLQPDGEVAHTIVGSSPLVTFMDKIKTFFGEETEMAKLDREYAGGKMKKPGLLEYAQALAGVKRDDDARKVCQELLGKLSKKEKVSKEYWPLISGAVVYQAFEENFEFIMENREKFNKTVGEETIDAFLFSHYNGKLMPYLYGTPSEEWWKELEEVKQTVAGVSFANKNLLEKKIALAEAKRDKNVDRTIDLMGEFPGLFEEKELFMLMSVPEFILDMATKEQLNRMAAWEDKYMACVNEERIPYMERLFAPYKRMATVGICWEQDTSFESLLLKAKIENKPIFMDCYTSWCAPCKLMVKNVFPQEKVGDFFNRNFICAKWDMEKGEGPRLLEKFEIRAFPTMLLINPDGDAGFQLVGGKDAEELIEAFKAGLENYRSFEDLKKQYARGERGKEFLKKYSKALYTAHSLDILKVVAELLPMVNDEERVSKEYWYIYGTPLLTAPGSDNEKYLIENRDRFRKSIGAEEVDMRLSFKYYMSFLKMMRGEENISPEQFKAMKDTLQSLNFTDHTVLSYANIVEAGKFKNIDEILTICEREFPTMLPERVPIDVFGRFIKDRMTPQQKARWIKLGKQMINRFEDERQREFMIKQLEKDMK